MAAWNGQLPAPRQPRPECIARRGPGARPRQRMSPASLAPIHCALEREATDMRVANPAAPKTSPCRCCRIGVSARLRVPGLLKVAQVGGPYGGRMRQWTRPAGAAIGMSPSTYLLRAACGTCALRCWMGAEWHSKGRAWPMARRSWWRSCWDRQVAAGGASNPSARFRWGRVLQREELTFFPTKCESHRSLVVF